MSAVRSVSARTFRAEVLQSTLPVVVDFYAPWCGPCRVLAPMLDEAARRYAGRVQVLGVNVDEEPALADHFAVSGVPALYFFRDGRLVRRIVGLPSPEQLEAELDGLAAPAPAWAAG